MSLHYKSLGTDIHIRYTRPSWFTGLGRNHLSAPGAVWHQWLDAQETARWQRLLKADSRHRFLVSHALLRATLASYAHVDPDAIVFDHLPKGKPIVAKPQTLAGLHFNMSHSHDMAAIAVSQSGPVGIDLEWLGRKGPDIAFAQRFFTEHEHQDILNQPLHRQHERLLSYWTLKEAYLKGQGWGLSISIKSFEFDLDSAQTPQLRTHTEAAQPTQNWGFKQFKLPGDHLTALAGTLTAGDNLVIDCQSWMEQLAPNEQI